MEMFVSTNKPYRMNGYLHKKGRGRKISFVKPWACRFFELNAETNTLRYYVDNNGDKSLRGEISLEECTVSALSKEVTGRPYTFEIKFKSPWNRSDDIEQSSLLLAAAESDQRDNWVNAINAQIARQQSKSEQVKKVADWDVSDPSQEAVDVSDPTPLSTVATDNELLTSTGSQTLIVDAPLSSVTPSDPEQSHTPSTPADSGKLALDPSTAVVIVPPTSTPVVIGVAPVAHNDFYSSGVADSPPVISADSRFPHLRLSVGDFSFDKDGPASGTGGYGVVHKAVRKSDGKLFAAKFFGYAKRDPGTISIWDEIEVMLKLKGSDVFVQVEGYFLDTHDGLLAGKKFPGEFPVIIMEYVNHDLLSFLASNATAQDTLPTVFRELVGGLEYLHNSGFVHRDLKVDNVMINGERRVKLIDFGLLVSLAEGKAEYQGSQAGTIGYFAPESIPLSGRAKFSAKSDVWQAGVVLYVLLSGSLPFNISSVNIRKGKYAPMTGSQWEKRSEDAKDLVRRMLVVNPKERISCSEILQHSWLADSAPKEVFDREYYQRMTSLAMRRNIKRMLEELRAGSEGDEQFDRAERAFVISSIIELTSDDRYFKLRCGAMKSWLFQQLHGDYTYCSTMTYPQYAELMATHTLSELKSWAVFDIMVRDNQEAEEGVSECGEGDVRRLSVKELVLTLTSLCLMEDQDDDAFITFMKFDVNGDGYISREEMEVLFRSILEEEAEKVMAGEERGEVVDIEGEMEAIEGVLSSIVINNPKGIEFVEFKNFFDTAMKISNSMSIRMSMGMSVRMSMRLMSAAKSARITIANKKPIMRQQKSH